MRWLLTIALAATIASPRQAAPLTAPFNLVIEPRGTLLVADGDSGRIVRIDPATGRRSVFAEGLGTVYDLAYGPGGLYVSTATQVVRFASGKEQVLLKGLHDPIGIAVARDGTLYVAEATRNRVLRFAARTLTRTVVASARLSQPLGLALRPDGSLLVADSRNGRIVSVGKGGQVKPVLIGLGLPVALAAGSGGSIYVVDHVEHGQKGKILRLHRHGTADTIATGKIRDLSSVAAGRAGALYATSFRAPFVGRLDATGRLRPLPAG